MKKKRKIWVLLLVVLLCMGIMISPVSAATMEQDGLKVELTTDKDKYAEKEEIKVTLTVTNVTEKSIKNISLESIVPEGYKLVKDSKVNESIEKLDSGQSITLQAVYEPKSSDGIGKPQSSSASTKTGDSANIVLWIALALIAFTFFVILFPLNKKKGKRFLAWFLAIILTGISFMETSVEVKADVLQKEVKVKTSIQVGNKKKEISALVKYELENTEEPNIPDIPDIPEDSTKVTREEWVVELSKALGLEEVSDGQYSYDDYKDVEASKMIEAAIRRGFVPVAPDQDNMVYFQPKEYVTREFAAYTAVHALNYQLVDGNEEEWGDFSELKYPIEATLSVHTEILTLIDNNFCPDKILTVTEKEHALNKIKEIIESGEISKEAEGEVQYVENVDRTKLLYELDEANKKVYILEPEKTADWKVGEVHALFSQDGTQKDIAIKVVSIFQEDGTTIISYEEPALDEVVVSLEMEGSEATQGELIPAEGVIIQDEIETREATTGSLKLFGKKKVSLNIEGISFSGTLDLKELEYRFSASPSWHILTINEVYLAINSSFDFDVSYTADYLAGKDVKCKLGTFKSPLGYGFNASGDIYIVFKAEGGVELGVELSAKNGIQYTKNGGIRPVYDVDTELKSFKINAVGIKLGPVFEIGAEFLGIDLVAVGAQGGVAFDGSIDNISVVPIQFCVDGTAYLYLGIFARIGWEDLNLQYDGELFNSDNSIWKESLHVEETGLIDNCTRGSGNYDGYVKRADNSEPVENAKVQVFKDNKLKDTTYTDNGGKFVGISLKSGSYKLRVSASGYHPYEQNIQIIGGQTTTLETQLMIARDDGQGENVSCSGMITDAYTGGSIANAKIKVYSQYLPGFLSEQEVVTEVTTNTYGEYTFNVPAGKYELEVSKEGYATNSKNITLVSDKNDVHISLSPENQGVVGGNLRVVLHWGAQPSDLDSHMVGPQGEGRFHVYYSNKRAEHVDLDVDDRSSYGPETISIKESEPGIYSYYIHDYTNLGSRDSTALSMSGAYIELYSDNDLIYTIHVPENKGGTLWHVFDYDSETDKITLVNEFSYVSNPGAVGGLETVSEFKEKDSKNKEELKELKEKNTEMPEETKDEAEQISESIKEENVPEGTKEENNKVSEEIGELERGNE